MNSLKNSNKELIKVFVVLGSDKSLVSTQRKKDIHGNNYYVGFIWDIWKKIQFELKDKYNFKLFFSELDDQNYDIPYRANLYSDGTLSKDGTSGWSTAIVAERPKLKKFHRKVFLFSDIYVVFARS